MEGNPTQDEKLPKDFVNLLAQNDGRLWAALLIGLLQRRITTYYLSPGLRNAPLIAALKHGPNTQINVVLDERSAAYQALGHILGTGQACALVCTSGSALANYFPAVLEAYYSNLPLIIISADRPPETVARGAPQTIKQTGLFGDFAPCLDLGNQMQNPGDFALALDRFLSPLESPLHINIPFQEPLGSESTFVDSRLQAHALDILLTPQPGGQKIVLESANLNKPEQINRELDLASSPLVVVGEMKKASDRNGIAAFLKQSNIPFYLDVTSGIKYSFDLDSGLIPSLEHRESLEYMASLNIDLVLHFGGRLVSQEYTRFLCQHPCKILHVCSSSPRWDFERPSDRHILGSLQNICPRLNKKAFPVLSRDWIKEKCRIIENSPLSFAGISKFIIEHISAKSNLFIGNSTAIRAFDNFVSLGFKKDLFLHANRGVNGIEGPIATSLGIAESTKRPTTAVVGDLSFLHDLNSLQSMQNLKTPLLIVLVNDGGGGIFHLLPIAQEEDILPYITSPHKLRFEEIAKQFSLPYAQVASAQELSKHYPNMKRGILEIILDTQNNRQVYKRLKTVKSP